MIKAVLFDWDRTLAQTRLAKALLAFTLMVKYKVNPFKAIYNYIKHSNECTFVILKESLKVVDESKLEEDYINLFKRLSWLVWLSDRNILKDLKEKGIKIAIVSNDLNQNIAHKLKGEEYDLLIGYKDCINRKPHPEPIHLALKKLNVKPSEAIYVGDIKTDMIAAKAAGVEAIGFATIFTARKLKKAGAWKIIYRLKSIKKLI